MGMMPAMRKIAEPHTVVLAPPGQDVAADGVVEEGGVDLVVEVFAWAFLIIRPSRLSPVMK